MLPPELFSGPNGPPSEQEERPELADLGLLPEGEASTPPAIEPSRFLETAPGWLFSLSIHGMILLACAATLSSVGSGGGSGGMGVGGAQAIEASWVGDGSEDLRGLGGEGLRDAGPIVEIAPPEQREPSAPAEATSEPVVPKKTAARPSPSGIQPAAYEPEEPRETRPASPPRLKGGAGKPGVGEGGSGGGRKPGARGGAGEGPGDGGAGIGLSGSGTSFFGIRTGGRRIVYVIDCSESMEGEPLEVAKQELLDSLDELGTPHRFGILFYNRGVKEMPAGSGSSGSLPVVSDISRRVARQFLDGVRAEEGTDHARALRRALQLNPDVIYFLTDAGEPELSPDDLKTIRQLNRGRAVIHCIEFDAGPERRTDGNFLKTLAQENGGRHRACRLDLTEREPAR